MGDNKYHLTLYGVSPARQLYISLLIILVPGILIFIFLLFAGTFFFSGAPDINTFPELDINKADIPFLRYLLIVQGISIFIIPGIVILKLISPVKQKGFAFSSRPAATDIGLVVLLAFCLFPVTSITGQLNSEMNLPDWLSGIETWMIDREDNATNLIGLVIPSSTFGVMLLNLLMIAIIPALGEEMIFRGVFQKIGYSLFRSGHTAVWVTAFIFSAIHFQFYGFIPRLILGLVFGYLFMWSGTLWLPVISHFINNAVPVVGSYIEGWDKINSPGDISLAGQLIRLPLPVIVGVLILFYFWKKFNERSGGLTKKSLK